MRYYPLFLDLQATDCLIVGAGPVGRRKAAALLEYPIRELQLVDPVPANLPSWSKDPRVIISQRDFAEADLEGKSLVFAATANQPLNDRIAGLCAQRNILCNTATGKAGSFLVPALAQSGPIQIAVSTQGASPALSKFLKHELASWLDSGYGNLAVLFAELRPLILDLNLPQAENAHLFNLLCAKDNLEVLVRELRENNRVALQITLQKLLPPALHLALASLTAKALNTIAETNAQ